MELSNLCNTANLAEIVVNTKEWMRRLRIAVEECNDKEIYRQLKEQLIHGLNDDNMLINIIHELSTIKDPNVVTREQVVTWAR